eukprot:scaffold53022_cov20-Tisochrysis_lutea.AAC.3
MPRDAAGQRRLPQDGTLPHHRIIHGPPIWVAGWAVGVGHMGRSGRCRLPRPCRSAHPHTSVSAYHFSMHLHFISEAHWARVSSVAFPAPAVALIPIQARLVSDARLNWAGFKKCAERYEDLYQMHRSGRQRLPGPSCHAHPHMIMSACLFQRLLAIRIRSRL